MARRSSKETGMADDEDKKRQKDDAPEASEREQVTRLEQEAVREVERIKPVPAPKGVNVEREPFPWEADPTALVPKH